MQNIILPTSDYRPLTNDFQYTPIVISVRNRNSASKQVLNCSLTLLLKLFTAKLRREGDYYKVDWVPNEKDDQIKLIEVCTL